MRSSVVMNARITDWNPFRPFKIKTIDIAGDIVDEYVHRVYLFWVYLLTEQITDCTAVSDSVDDLKLFLKIGC